jgi:ATP-dependent DNA helicase DinG
MPTAAEILAPDGQLAQLLPGYESRPQQVAMAALIDEALATRQHVVVEAPTGVGKSLAYLIPLVRHALSGGAPVVVSTATIALQEQLIGKDIPLVQQLFPELHAVLVKGRSNYVSLRRLEVAVRDQRRLFEASTDSEWLRDLATWSGETETGDRSELGREPPSAVWRAVQSDRNNCQGRRCPHFSDCHFYRARAALEGAHLLVVNHHLYLSDLALRDDHAGILPPHRVVVFDEAHSLEDIATDYLGAGVSAAQVRHLLDGLWSGKGRGLLADDRHDAARPAVEAAHAASARFWDEVVRLVGTGADDKVRLGPGAVEDVLAPSLDAVGAALAERAGAEPDENTRMELKAQQAQCAAIAGTIRALLTQGDPAQVYFATAPRGRGAPALTMSPLSVADQLKDKLFSQLGTAVLTSATLAADDSDRFLFLRRRLGLEGGLAKRLDSPFDYTQQATLVLNRAAFDPNSAAYERAVAHWLGDWLPRMHGGAFVLFTSYRQLQAVHDLARPALDRARRFVLRQGAGMPRSQMLDLFKRTGDAVLFGTASFWEGVDVPGDALRLVVICKLPFEVPSEPVIQARHEAITQRGGNAFMERTVPEAILRLKQGFGRLIRRRTDTGSVAILDPRILGKSYGRYFLKALPQCRTEIVELVDPAG